MIQIRYLISYAEKSAVNDRNGPQIKNKTIEHVIETKFHVDFIPLYFLLTVCTVPDGNLTPVFDLIANRKKKFLFHNARYKSATVAIY